MKIHIILSGSQNTRAKKCKLLDEKIEVGLNDTDTATEEVCLKLALEQLRDLGCFSNAVLEEVCWRLKKRNKGGTLLPAFNEDGRIQRGKSDLFLLPDRDVSEDVIPKQDRNKLKRELDEQDNSAELGAKSSACKRMKHNDCDRESCQIKYVRHRKKISKLKRTVSKKNRTISKRDRTILEQERTIKQLREAMEQTSLNKLASHDEQTESEMSLDNTGISQAALKPEVSTLLEMPNPDVDDTFDATGMRRNLQDVLQDTGSNLSEPVNNNYRSPMESDDSTLSSLMETSDDDLPGPSGLTTSNLPVAKSGLLQTIENHSYPLETSTTALPEPLESTTTTSSNKLESTTAAPFDQLETTQAAPSHPLDTTETSPDDQLVTIETTPATPHNPLKTTETAPDDSSDITKTSPDDQLVIVETTPSAPHNLLKTTETAPDDSSDITKTSPDNQLVIVETTPSTSHNPLKTTETAPDDSFETAETCPPTPSNPLNTIETAPSDPLEHTQTAPSNPLENTDTASPNPLGTTRTVPFDQPGTKTIPPSKSLELETTETAPSDPLENTETSPSNPLENTDIASPNPLGTTRTVPFDQPGTKTIPPSKSLELETTEAAPSAPANRLETTKTNPSNPLEATETTSLGNLETTETTPSDPLETTKTGSFDSLETTKGVPSNQLEITKTPPSGPSETSTALTASHQLETTAIASSKSQESTETSPCKPLKIIKEAVCDQLESSKTAVSDSLKTTETAAHLPTLDQSHDAKHMQETSRDFKGHQSIQEDVSQQLSKQGNPVDLWPQAEKQTTGILGPVRHPIEVKQRVGVQQPVEVKQPVGVEQAVDDKGKVEVAIGSKAFSPQRYQTSGRSETGCCIPSQASEDCSQPDKFSHPRKDGKQAGKHARTPPLTAQPLNFENQRLDKEVNSTDPPLRRPRKPNKDSRRPCVPCSPPEDAADSSGSTAPSTTTQAARHPDPEDPAAATPSRCRSTPITCQIDSLVSASTNADLQAVLVDPEIEIPSDSDLELDKMDTGKLEKGLEIETESEDCEPESLGE